MRGRRQPAEELLWCWCCLGLEKVIGMRNLPVERTVGERNFYATCSVCYEKVKERGDTCGLVSWGRIIAIFPI